MAKKKPRHPKACRLGNINKDGSENICSKPTELRAKIIAPVSLRQKMQSLWAEFSANEKANSQLETIEDASDFDINDNEFPTSQYEIEGEFAEKLNQHLDEAVYNNEQVQPAEEENNDGKIPDQTTEE